MGEEKICEVHRLGTLDYLSARAIQKKLARSIGAGTRPAALILVEHPHTFTFGRRGKPENLLCARVTPASGCSPTSLHDAGIVRLPRARPHPNSPRSECA